MTRAAIYARFSSSRQREASVEDQERVCRAYCDREGYDVVHVYADRAKSGREATHRAAFQRMLADAERGGFDVVVVWMMERFARNRYDSAVYKMQLRRIGVRVESATEMIPNGPEGIFTEGLLEIQAEYFSANLAKNVRRGMEGNALKCKHNGARVFGYENGADGMYHIDETEAEGVRMAFRMASEGARKADIAAALNSTGYRTVRGRRWTVEAVSQLLRQEKYLGTYSWGKVRVEHGMPAIVTRAEWEDAHAHVASAGRRKRTETPAEYILTGKLYDERGNRFESNCSRKPDGRIYYYYRCKATGASVRRDEVEARVCAALGDLLDSTPALEDAIVDAVMASWREANEADLAALEAVRRRLADLDREADNLIDLAARTRATDRIAARLDAIEDERPTLEADLADLERGIPRLEPDMVRYMLWRVRQCDGPAAVCSGLVSRVIIGDDGSCLVTFNLYEPSACENDEKEKTQTPGAGVWGNGFGRPRLNLPKPHELVPWPGGFAIAA